MRGIPLRRRVRATRVIGAVTALLLSAGALAACATGSTDADGPAPSQTATPTPTPTPTPLTPAEQLLAANTSVAGACAVSFQLDGATIDPQLQVQDHLFDRLPIPRAAGRAFAGWYADPAAAAAASADPTTGAANPAVRVNGSHLVACPTHQLTHGRTVHPEAVGQLLHGHLCGVGIEQRRTIRGIQTSLRLTRFFDHRSPSVGPLGRRATCSARSRCLVDTGNQRTQGLAGV